MMYVLSMLLKCVNLICYIYNRISSAVPSCLKNILRISIKYLKQDGERKGDEGLDYLTLFRITTMKLMT